MKNQIRMLIQDKRTDKHLRWEFLKYEMRKCTMNFLKSLVKKENKDRKFLEKELNRLEKNLTNFKQISTISNINKSFKIYILKKLMEYKSGVNVTGTGMEKSQLNSF